MKIFLMQTLAAKPRWLFALLAVIVLLSLAFGVYFFIHSRVALSQGEQYEHLATVARLKSDQLLAWREERLADARLNTSGMIRALAIEWHRTGNPGDLVSIAFRLKLFREYEGYHNIILTNSSGETLVSLLNRNSPPEKEEKALVAAALSRNQPVLGNFYFCQACNKTHIHVAAPVVGEEGEPIAALILVVDPGLDIFPLMQTWPVPHANAESFLVRGEKDQVRFLTPLRHKNVQPLSFTMAMSSDGAPAVLAALGRSGMVLGTDYRGEPVLADIRAIPGTPWHMVSKVDLKPIRANTVLQSSGILLLVGLAIAVTAVCARLAAVSRQKNLTEALLWAEQESKQSREEIRATLYGIGDGVLSVNQDGRVTRMNPEAERLTGWREEDALGEPLAVVFRLFAEKGGEAIELPLSRVLVEGERMTASNQAVLASKQGTLWPIADNWSPIRDEQKRITGAVIVFRDQTRRRRMEKAQAESARRYSDLVESVHDLIWETGPDHRVTFVSGRSTMMLGFTPEEIIDRSWDGFLQARQDEGDTAAEAFRITLGSHEPYSQLMQTFRRKDGSRVVLESSATPVFDQGGVFQGYRGISRDITDRQQAEEEQKRLEAQLHQAQKMDTVGRLAGGVAHDFNNMLTVICSYTEMILMEIGEKHPLYKQLVEVHRAGLHSADLTRQLLAFARKQVISPQVLDLNDVIHGTLKMLERLIGENIHLIWQPGADLWPVRMDPTQVGQVLANLAVNARDAIGDTGHLVLATENLTLDEAACAGRFELVPGDYVRLAVSDNGCGMDEETRNHIFEPFFTTKGEGRGTGLGLATVYGIIHQNGGYISVYSELGQGTTVRIYLPRQHQLTDIATTLIPSGEEKGHETILICEDEPSILDLGVSILERKGYTVLAARTPSAALDLAASHPGPIHLLITDVIMPEMNGRDLMEHFSHLRPMAKGLFMSGYTADIIAHHGVLDPGLEFIEKPFTARNLCAKVREILVPT